MPAVVGGLCHGKVEKVTGGVGVGPSRVMRNLPGRERHRRGKEKGEGRTLTQCGVGNQPAGPGLTERE